MGITLEPPAHWLEFEYKCMHTQDLTIFTGKVKCQSERDFLVLINKWNTRPYLTKGMWIYWGELPFEDIEYAQIKTQNC